MWPQPVHNEEAYLIGVASLFMRLPAEQVEGLRAMTKVHEFPPSIAAIHEWTKPPPPPSTAYGPNFTQERLNREARGEPDYVKAGTSESRAAFVDGLIGKGWRR